MSGAILDVTERPSKNGAPPLYRISSINFELDILSSLTSSVSFEIKLGSLSKLSRLFFLKGANGTPGSVIKGHKVEFKALIGLTLVFDLPPKYTNGLRHVLGKHRKDQNDHI